MPPSGSGASLIPQYLQLTSENPGSLNLRVWNDLKEFWGLKSPVVFEGKIISSSVKKIETPIFQHEGITQLAFECEIGTGTCSLRLEIGLIERVAQMTLDRSIKTPFEPLVQIPLQDILLLLDPSRISPDKPMGITLDKLVEPALKSLEKEFKTIKVYENKRIVMCLSEKITEINNLPQCPR